MITFYLIIAKTFTQFIFRFTTKNFKSWWRLDKERKWKVKKRDKTKGWSFKTERESENKRESKQKGDPSRDIERERLRERVETRETHKRDKQSKKNNKIKKKPNKIKKNQINLKKKPNFNIFLESREKKHVGFSFFWAIAILSL